MKNKYIKVKSPWREKKSCSREEKRKGFGWSFAKIYSAIYLFLVFNCLNEARERKEAARLLELLIHVIMAVIEQVVGCHLLVTVACQESLYGCLTIESKVLQLIIKNT